MTVKYPQKNHVWASDVDVYVRDIDPDFAWPNSFCELEAKSEGEILYTFSRFRVVQIELNMH